MRNRVFSALVAMAALLSSNPCGAETFAIGSDQIRFELDGKYCFIEPEKSPFDRKLMQSQRTANQGLNAVIFMFMECAIRDSYRQGKAIPFGQYGILLGLAAQTGAPQKFSGYTRSQVLAEVNQLAQKGFPKLDAKHEQARWDSLLPKGLKAGESKELGPLRLDEIASYRGMAVSYEVNGKPGPTMAAVVAVTLLKDYIVQLSLYRQFVDKATYETLLKEQTVLMPKLVSQNEP